MTKCDNCYRHTGGTGDDWRTFICGFCGSKTLYYCINCVGHAISSAGDCFISTGLALEAHHNQENHTPINIT